MIASKPEKRSFKNWTTCIGVLDEAIRVNPRMSEKRTVAFA
jgi:hypothetical protein